MTSGQVLVLPNVLIGWRKKKGISLSAIAAATNISPRYLEAIERGEFQKLPGGVYSLSYVRQYARAIQYDEEELLEYYRTLVGTVEIPPEPSPRRLTRMLDRLSAFWSAAKLRRTYTGISSPVSRKAL